uniref:Uncharacterized protein n=1 Tax=Ciona intestinalis TaxID=7719 RepID=H2Y2M0_CIOIN
MVNTGSEDFFCSGDRRERALRGDKIPLQRAVDGFTFSRHLLTGETGES